MAYDFVSGQNALAAALAPCAPSKIGTDWLVRFDCVINMADGWQASVFSIGEMAKLTAEGWAQARSPNADIRAAQTDLISTTKRFADLLKSTSLKWRELIQKGREYVQLLRANELEAAKQGNSTMIEKIQNQKQAAFVDAAIPLADYSFLHMTIADQFRALVSEMSGEIVRSDARNLAARTRVLKEWEATIRRHKSFWGRLWGFFATLTTDLPMLLGYGVLAWLGFQAYKFVKGRR